MSRAARRPAAARPPAAAAPRQSAKRRRRSGPPAVLPERPPFTDIWRVVAALASGTVASYGEVARRAGLPRGARLAAFALKRAPESLRLPWHRVVGAGGRIAFPRGSRAAAEQARRLAREGLRVERGRIRTTPQDARSRLDALLWHPDGG